MPTPAKDRFFKHVLETVDMLDYNCMVLSKDAPKFNSAYLTHSIAIIGGMAQRIRRHLLVNRASLINSLPKGVLKHGDKRVKKGRQSKAPRQ